MLRVVHISGIDAVMPKKQSAKQIKAMEIQALIFEQRMKDRRTALKMTERLKEILK